MKKYFSISLISAVIMGLSTFQVKEILPEKEETPPLVTPSEAIFALKAPTLPVDAAATNHPLDLAIFAWQEMIALNWKATYGNTVKNKISYERDVADTTWNYSMSAPDGASKGHTVWETYAHRSELRPVKKGQFDKITSKNLDGQPQYNFGEVKNGKKEYVSINYQKPSDQHLLNCLDEDNEIGSCILFHNVQNHSPLDATSLTDQVMYQAKINKVGWNYRRLNFPTRDIILKAGNRVVTPIKKGSKVTRPDRAKLMGHAGSCESDSLTSKGYICFPCSGKKYNKKIDPQQGAQGSQGVIEIKTAWRERNSNDHPNEYLIRKTIVFEKVDDTNYNAQSKEFVLIGMHINRKTVNYPTFVIATWEHESVRKQSENYKYISKPGGDGDYNELYNIRRAKPGRGDAIDFYDQVSKMAQTAIGKMNPNHYLKHYRLVGVQGHYENGYPQDTTQKSFFLSNTVIESDKALRDFYGSFGSPQKGTQENFFNLVNKDGNFIVTGGCKGCHGVAQTRGSDMSFLMDKNKPAAPDEFDISLTEIGRDYFTARSIVANGTSTFLSPKINGKIGGYIRFYADLFFTTFLYNKKFKNYGLTDVDGYPAANLKFIDYKELSHDPISGTIKGSAKLQYTKQGKFNNQYVSLDPQSVHVSKDAPSYNQFNLSTDPSKAIQFDITLKPGGIVEFRSMKGDPVVLHRVSKDLYFADKTKVLNPTQFVVYGFTDANLKAIN